MIRIVIFLALIVLPISAMSQQRTVYGADGRVISRSTIDTQGTRTLYGSDGRVISRETRDGTIYDARTGNAVGKISKEKR